MIIIYIPLLGNSLLNYIIFNGSFIYYHIYGLSLQVQSPRVNVYAHNKFIHNSFTNVRSEVDVNFNSRMFNENQIFVDYLI